MRSKSPEDMGTQGTVQRAYPAGSAVTLPSYYLLAQKKEVRGGGGQRKPGV